MELENKQKRCIIRVREEGTNKIQIEEHESPKLGCAPMVTKWTKQKFPKWVLSKTWKIQNKEE